MKLNFSSTKAAMIVAFVLYVACPATGQESEEIKIDRPDFKVVDADSDGDISLEELKSFLIESHLDDWSKQVDSDDVSQEDLEVIFSDKYAAIWAARMDANANGKISKWELRLISKALGVMLEEEGKAIEVGEGAEEKGQPSPSMVDAMNQQFQGEKPVLGTRVDDLAAIDETGKEISFEDFQGKHVVVIFGCLT